VRVLLDTHVFLWWMEQNPRLDAAHFEAIEDPENEVFVSAASTWETMIKAALGKVELPDGFERILPDLIHRGQIAFLPINMEHTLEIRRLPAIHRDPFDRMLIAQARVENMRLASLDQMIRQYDAPLLP